MKKFISYLLVAIMCLSSLVACGEEKGNDELKAAVDYVYAMYKDAGTITAKDFERTAQVIIGTNTYAVEWTTDNEAVKVTVADKIATIDVDEKSATDVNYTLTATVKDANGNSATKEFKYTVPKFEGYEKIVKDAYKLESGAVMDGTFTVEGVIVKVDTPYDAGYGNVTVTIQVGELKDMPLMCYRLKGEGADTIKIGDTITVTGSIKNYNGTIEFDAGCTLDKVVAGEAPSNTLPSDATAEQIVNAAYDAMNNSTPMIGDYTLTGVITSIDTEWSDQYGNITVSMVINGLTEKPIQCYRLNGDGAATLAVGDTITVLGSFGSYNGKVQYNAGCTLTKVVKGEGGTTTTPDPEPTPDPNPGTTLSTPADIMAATEKLADGEYLGGSQDSVYKLSGVITKIEGTWNSKYGNMPVTIKVDGTDGKTIYCYGVKCDENDQFKVGEKITVEGCIKNYGGLIEFWCPTLVSRDKTGAGSTDKPAGTTPTTPAEIVTAAYALASGETLEGGPYTLTGKITEIKTAPAASTYTEGYWEAQLTISVEGKDFFCYWLKGTEAQMKDLKVGDTITVKGTIKNYNDTIEFDKPYME